MEYKGIRQRLLSLHQITFEAEVLSLRNVNVTFDGLDSIIRLRPDEFDTNEKFIGTKYAAFPLRSHPFTSALDASSYFPLSFSCDYQ